MGNDSSLLVEDVLIVDDSFQVLHVDVTVNDNHRIAQITRIRDDDFAQVLAVTTHKHRPLLTVALLRGDDFLIGTVPVKILDVFAELIANTVTTLAQIKQLNRCDAQTSLGQSG